MGGTGACVGAAEMEAKTSLKPVMGAWKKVGVVAWVAATTAVPTEPRSAESGDSRAAAVMAACMTAGSLKAAVMSAAMASGS